MGAMPEEVDGIRAELESAAVREIGGRIYSSGQWHGTEVVLVFSRWGKVAAASTASTLLDRFEVDGILFIGVAGAAHPDLRVGDVVIATELVQHDMDASALPMFERFEIPLLGRQRFTAHPPWAELATRETKRYLEGDFAREVGAAARAEFALDRPKCIAGLVASGDRFIADAAVIAELRQSLPDLLCVEMEGAAVAQVCHEFGRPLAVVRVISDAADHDAAVDFPRFVAAVATPMTLGVASRLLKSLASAIPLGPQTA